MDIGASGILSQKRERMTTAETLERGRESFGRHDWTDAYARFSAADRENALGPDDLERLATTAYLTRKDALKDVL